MSHLDAPLLSRRHPDNFDHYRERQPRRLSYIHSTANDPAPEFDEPTSASSSSSARSRPPTFKALLLPAELQLRRVSQAAKRHLNPVQRALSSDGLRFHEIGKRQSTSSSSSSSEIDPALSTVTASTSCRTVVENAGGANVAALRRECGRAVAEAVEAAEASTSAGAGSTAGRSTAAAAATTTSATSPRRVTATTRRRRTTTARTTEALEGTASGISSVDSLFSSALSIVSTREAAASASRASLQSSVDSIFSSALGVVSSRESAATATASASTSISNAIIPISTSFSSSSSSSTATSSELSSSPSIASSAFASSAVASSATSSSSAAAPSSSSAHKHHRNLAAIVAPSVAVPIGVLLLLLLGFCCYRRRKHRKDPYGRATPTSLGTISGPRPLRLNANYGTATRGPDAGAAAGAPATGRGGRNASNDSFRTSPSAIGVAYSEPRTKWGRKSLVDVLAVGVRNASHSPKGTGQGGRNTPRERLVSAASSFGGRQPSITSVPSVDRGVGGYNSRGGYQPGMPRPVMSTIPQYFDQFGPPPTIVPVPASARHPQGRSPSLGSMSAYDGESTTDSRESWTQRLAPPVSAGYPLAGAPGAQDSRVTQATTDGEEGFWTADGGVSSGQEEEEELRLGERTEAAVNFGSGSSGTGSTSPASHSNSTPRMEGSRTSTPRLGAGHGSGGFRRGDGSWWN
ncbi:SPOSA6832_00326, partial [Sporobolomyces salmonicolor]